MCRSDHTRRTLLHSLLVAKRCWMATTRSGPAAARERARGVTPWAGKALVTGAAEVAMRLGTGPAVSMPSAEAVADRR